MTRAQLEELRETVNALKAFERLLQSAPYFDPKMREKLEEAIRVGEAQIKSEFVS